MSFKIFLEAFLNQDIILAIKKQLETEGYASVHIHNNGVIDLEYPSRSFRAKEGSVFLDPKTKKIDVKDIAGKIQAQTQKLLKALMSAGIIDNTWSIGSNHVMPGEYAPSGSDYNKLDPQIAKKSIQDLLSDPTFSKTAQDLTLYHGTSSIDWEQIQKQGALKPLFLGSKEYGSESRAKHEYNKNLLYLATNESKAWDYAKSRASSMNRKMFPEDWKYSQYQGAARWRIKPVLLKIEVPDIGKLRTDDDIVNNVMKKYSRKIWDRKPETEKQHLIKLISRAAGFDISSSPDYVWRETNRGFKEILAKIRPEIYHAYMSSILRSEQVGYEGIIPIKFITEIPFVSRDLSN